MTADGRPENYVAAEQRARMNIDAQLANCGWIVQDASAANVTAGRGVAVREFILEGGHGRADYLLYVGGEAVGVDAVGVDENPFGGDACL